MGKAFEKQIKTIENQGQKQVEALKNIKPKEHTKANEGECNDKSGGKKYLTISLKKK